MYVYFAVPIFSAPEGFKLEGNDVIRYVYKKGCTAEIFALEQEKHLEALEIWAKNLEKKEG